MICKLTNRIKRYPITIILVLVIWYLSMFTPPKVDLGDVRFIDKWAHLLMYGTLVFVLWMEDWRTRLCAAPMTRIATLYIAPVIMSGIIELAQAYCTTNRSGDWLDLAANAAGALAGLTFGIWITRTSDRKNRR